MQEEKYLMHLVFFLDYRKEGKIRENRLFKKRVIMLLEENPNNKWVLPKKEENK